MKKFYQSLFFQPRFYWSFSGIIFFFLAGYFLDFFYQIGELILLAWIALIVMDFILLWLTRGNLRLERIVPEKFSNGDDNMVYLTITNGYAMKVHLEIMDEVPVQFQIRDFSLKAECGAGEEYRMNYKLRPLVRGEYHFGQTRVMAHTFIGIMKRRFSFGNQTMVPVYPSFIQMRRYELMAVSNRLEEVGIKRLRKLGVQSEFDQVREYVYGDDYRTMNWKATARKNSLMVNQYQDEKAQEVYCLIDMGRVMKMPFAGMTLLDYAINTSLVISGIALNKQDKAGIIPFSNKSEVFLPADRRSLQMHKILELLYNLDTNFQEPNYEMLYLQIKRNIKRRSLLILFTNFESVPSMQRHLPMLKKLGTNHLLLTVFFQNTELNKLLVPENQSLENVYNSIVAEGFIYDKKLIVKELNNHGIHALLTEPNNLSVNLINKYLAMKAQGLI